MFVDLKDGEVTCVMYLVSEQSYIYHIYYKQYGSDFRCVRIYFTELPMVC